MPPTLLAAALRCNAAAMHSASARVRPQKFQCSRCRRQAVATQKGKQATCLPPRAARQQPLQPNAAPGRLLSYTAHRDRHPEIVTVSPGRCRRYERHVRPKRVAGASVTPDGHEHCKETSLEECRMNASKHKGALALPHPVPIRHGTPRSARAAAQLATSTVLLRCGAWCGSGRVADASYSSGTTCMPPPESKRRSAAPPLMGTAARRNEPAKRIRCI